MNKLIFKPFEWDSTDGPAIDLLNQLGCNAYVTYRKLEDGTLTYEAAFSGTYKRGFDSQEDAKAWVEKEFKEAIEWHVKCSSKNKILDAIREEWCDIKHRREFDEDYDEEKANIEIQLIKKIINKIKDL